MKVSQTDEHTIAALTESLEKVHLVLEKLVTLFETANKDIYDEYSKGLHDTSFVQKLEQLSQQNEKIARGMVALADIVKGLQKAPVAPMLTPVSAPIPTNSTTTFTFQDTTSIPPAIPSAPATPTKPVPEEIMKQASQTQPPQLPPLPIALPTTPAIPSQIPPPKAPVLPSPAPEQKRKSLLEKFSFK